MDYYQKYQKYRFKYLNLLKLNQSGGEIDDQLIIAVLNNPLELKNIIVPDKPSPSCKRDYNYIILEAVKRNGLALKYVDKRYTHINLYFSAIAQNPDALQYVINEENIDTTNITNEEYFNICMEAVKNKGSTVEHVYKLKLEGVEKGEAYYLILLKAVEQDWRVLKNIKSNEFYILKYVKICKEAVKNNGMALEHIDAYTFRFTSEEYFEICKEAVAKVGDALQYVKNKKINPNQYKEICDLAVQQNPDAIKYIK